MHHARFTRTKVCLCESISHDPDFVLRSHLENYVYCVDSHWHWISEVPHRVVDASQVFNVRGFARHQATIVSAWLGAHTPAGIEIEAVLFTTVLTTGSR